MIQVNKVKEKIRQNKPALGGWVMTASPVSAGIMAQAGFDWVCLDAEHSPVTKETAQNIFTAIERHEAEPFVRIALNDEIECKKFLDMGARGILVPMIKSYQDILKAISFTKYAPEGNRSFALARATGYGKFSAEYFEKANQELFLGIMIEHIDALKELDKIFSCKNIDAVLVGPYDLSGSMGIPGQFDNPDFETALNEINHKAKIYNIPMGIHEVHPTKEKIRSYINIGYCFIGCGIDTLFIAEAADEIIRAVP